MIVKKTVLILGAAAALAGCGGAGFILGGRPTAVVQSDVHLPRGTRVAVIPVTLYGYSKEQRRSVENSTYSTLVAAMLKNGFHVVERTLVEKAVEDYVRTKKFDKVPGAQGAIFQDSGDEEVERVIDLVDIGRTLNVRLVAAGSLQVTSSLMSSKVEVRMRATDVTNGEMVSHCEGTGSLSVIEGCAESMSAQLSVRMVGAHALGLR